MNNLMWNNSNNKFEVIIEPMKQYGNKLWIKIKFKDGTIWIPSFVDILRIIQPLYEVEEVKYPNDYNKGGKMVKEFVEDCCVPTNDIKVLWNDLKSKYQMDEIESKREGNTIMFEVADAKKSGGAKMDQEKERKLLEENEMKENKKWEPMYDKVRGYKI